MAPPSQGQPARDQPHQGGALATNEWGKDLTLCLGSQEWAGLMGEVSCTGRVYATMIHACLDLQGYLAHKKTPTPLEPPQNPRHGPAVGS